MLHAKRALCASIAFCGMFFSAVASPGLTSSPSFIFVQPDTTSFWRTATNNTLTVAVDYPSGATKAKLRVEGVDYVHEYADIEGVNAYTFELPAATSRETENVYKLELSFDDAAKTVRTARLGLVQGLGLGDKGSTRCLAPAGTKAWNRIKGRAVLPIPYGTTALEVNGESVDTGLGGAQGWYAVGVSPGKTVSLGLESGGTTYLANLIGGGLGLLLFVK